MFAEGTLYSEKYFRYFGVGLPTSIFFQLRRHFRGTAHEHWLHTNTWTLGSTIQDHAPVPRQVLGCFCLSRARSLSLSLSPLLHGGDCRLPSLRRVLCQVHRGCRSWTCRVRFRTSSQQYIVPQPNDFPQDQRGRPGILMRLALCTKPSWVAVTPWSPSSTDAMTE